MDKPTCFIDQCERPVLARARCATHYSYWYREQHGRKKEPPKGPPIKHPRVCEFCAHPFLTAERRSRYCSTQCANYGRFGWSKSKELQRYTRPKPIVTVSHVATKNRLTSGQCRVCSGWFVSPYMEVTCSYLCRATHYRAQRNEHDYRRRARERNAFIAPVNRRQVFLSDGYRCYLCGKMTDKRRKGSHPTAPSIDHVIPLAAGGTHEPSNCRTAHVLCNATKGDRGSGEQMLLFAI